MPIVIDSNILFSALIKDSITRKIIIEHEGIMLFPYYIFDEFYKHRDEIRQKSGMHPAEFDILMEYLMKKVTIVPKEALDPWHDEAATLAKDIDPDDAIFFACALAYPGSVIWSGDKRLKRQNAIKIIRTEEMIKL